MHKKTQASIKYRVVIFWQMFCYRTNLLILSQKKTSWNVINIKWFLPEKVKKLFRCEENVCKGRLINKNIVTIICDNIFFTCISFF